MNDIHESSVWLSDFVSCRTTNEISSLSTLEVCPVRDRVRNNRRPSAIFMHFSLLADQIHPCLAIMAAYKWCLPPFSMLCAWQFLHVLFTIFSMYNHCMRVWSICHTPIRICAYANAIVITTITNPTRPLNGHPIKWNDQSNYDMSGHLSLR